MERRADERSPNLLDRTELHLFDDQKLNLELRDTLSLDKSEAWIATLMATENADSAPWLRLGTNGGRSCYVGRISGAQLAELYTQHKSSLFTLNIRNYIGDTATNKAIKKTAIENPEEFFFFNNGISALVESIEADEADPRILKCKNLSIVNGAQTVRSLHRTQLQDPNAAKGVQVLIRLTETQSKKTSAEQEFLDSVTKFNNTQNAIRISDFRSNDKIQHDLRNRFASLPSLNGKKFSYKNKRSGPMERDAKRGGDINVGMEEFTKTLYGFLYGPDDVFGGTGFVFDATSDGGYAKLFGDGVEVMPSLDNELFERYAGIWFVCKQARDVWRDESRRTKHSSLERRWMFYFALGRVIARAYRGLETQYSADLRKLSSPAWTGEGPEGQVQKVIHRASRMAFQVLKLAYEENIKTGAGHRNWFRSPATLEAITARVNDQWGLVEEHAEEYRFRKSK